MIMNDTDFQCYLKWVLILKCEKHKAGQMAGDIETKEVFREIKQASVLLFDS